MFDPTMASEPLKELAGTTLPPTSTHTGTLTPYQVQASLLYCIALYWCDEIEEALRILDETIKLALVLGMNQEQFSIEHGHGDPVLEESIRRTWWLLYVTDGHIAGSTHTFPTRIGDVPMSVLLPCEEVFYESGVSG